MDPVAQRIEAIIEEKGYSHSGFAKAIGVQRANISHVLSGRNRPSLELVQRILRTFPDLDSEQLLLGVGGRQERSEKEDGDEKKAPPEKVPNKRIERVVICYDDGTFASYEADG
ncbi:MAG: helix-turn-helix transcriptional regulator [Flavobacteriales bacterium]